MREKSASPGLSLCPYSTLGCMYRADSTCSLSRYVRALTDCFSDLHCHAMGRKLSGVCSFFHAVLRFFTDVLRTCLSLYGDRGVGMSAYLRMFRESLPACMHACTDPFLALSLQGVVSYLGPPLSIFTVREMELLHNLLSRHPASLLRLCLHRQTERGMANE